MDDLISRQEAIDAMDTWDKFGCNPDGRLVRFDDNKHYVPYVRYDDMVYVIKSLPSAQPERKTGEWILSDVQNHEDVRNGNYTYTCSNCLHSDIHAKTAVVPFCWHCGADMSGADMRKEN